MELTEEIKERYEHPTILWNLNNTDKYHCLCCHADFCFESKGCISYCPCCGKIVADQNTIRFIERWNDRRKVN